MKLEYDEPLSNLAFNINLRRYTVAVLVLRGTGKVVCVFGRGLHSSTFWLNVSTFCWIRWVHDYPPVY